MGRVLAGMLADHHSRIHAFINSRDHAFARSLCFAFAHSCVTNHSRSRRPSLMASAICWVLRPVRFGASHAMASRGPATAAVAGADSLGKEFLANAMYGDLVSTSVASAACGGSGSVQAAHAAASSARRSVLKRAAGGGCLGSAGR